MKVLAVFLAITQDLLHSIVTVLRYISDAL